MSKGRYTKEKIFDLLPSIYKIRDNEQSGPLKALLEIIGEQVEFVEQDIARLYNNWFIETCDEWIVPYIGDLLNARILNPVTKSTSSHRSWVANTISYRRRKGTLATIEQLSRDVTGWNCRAVEFFLNLITTPYLNHLRTENSATIDLRNGDMLELIGTPFDGSRRSVDIRHINSKRGYYNLPNIGIFLWRLQAYPMRNVPAFSFGEGKYGFSQLGYDLALYNHPETETSIDHIATEVNVPTRIRRTALDKAIQSHISGSNFAYLNSIKIVKSLMVNGALIESEILPENIIACNLRNWQHRPPAGKVALDPELGRIIFPELEEVVDVHVSYYTGFSSEIGGGFYERAVPEILTSIDDRQNVLHYEINKKKQDTLHDKLSDALAEWRAAFTNTSRDAIFEITDSEIYANETDVNPLELEIPENTTIVIRAQKNQRPVLRLKKPIVIKGGSRSRIVFDGIIFVLTENPAEPLVGQLYDNNNTILKVANGDLSELIINHSTFGPGRTEHDSLGRMLFTWESIPNNPEDVTRLKNYLFDLLNEEWILADDVVLNKEGSDNNKIKVSSGTFDPILLDRNSISGTIAIKIVKESGQEYLTVNRLPSIESNNSLNVYSSMYSLAIFGDNSRAKNPSLKIFVSSSIMGRIDTWSCLGSLRISDSIVDGKGTIDAIRCYAASIENTTIFGKMSSVILNLASNSIFTDLINIDRRQEGCMRFCYIPNGSQVPRPFRCILEYESNNEFSISGTNGWSRGSLPSTNPIRVRPQFTSINYGDDGYGQLFKDVEQKIFEGGDNGSELGSFNNLYNPLRVKNLFSSLNEYLKFGLEAGVFLVT